MGQNWGLKWTPELTKHGTITGAKVTIHIIVLYCFPEPFFGLQLLVYVFSESNSSMSKLFNFGVALFLALADLLPLLLHKLLEPLVLETLEHVTLDHATACCV